MDQKVKQVTHKLLPAMAHGAIAKLFTNIWVVKGAVKMPMLMPIKISRSMVIIKNADTDELTLVNSLRLSETGLAALEKLGKVTNVIRVAGFHGRDDGFYRQRYGATVYAIKGQVYIRKFDHGSNPKEYMQADIYLDKDSPLPIKSAKLKIFASSKPPEAVLLLQQDGGVLITGDSLQNTAKPDEYVSFLAKKMMGKMGFFKAYNVGPGWLQFAKPEAAEVRSLLDLDFEHVLPGHGEPVIGGAKEKYRPVIEGKLKGCH